MPDFLNDTRLVNKESHQQNEDNWFSSNEGNFTCFLENNNSDCQNPVSLPSLFVAVVVMKENSNLCHLKIDHTKPESSIN